MNEQRNLVQKLAEVAASVERIPKNGWNDFHKYHYVLEADVVESVRKEMSSRSLIMFPNVTLMEWREGKPNRDGSVSPICVMTVEWTIKDGDSGEELKYVVPGTGQDSGDKGPYKAMTGSRKYALLELFQISTGDDPERESGHPPQDTGIRRGRPPLQKAGYSMGQGQPKIEPPLKPEPGTKRPDLSRVSVAVPERPPMGSTVEVLTLPDPETEATIEREKLLTHVSVLGQKLGLGPEDKRKHWATYCEGASPQKVDPAALKPLVDFLRLRCEQKGIKVELT